jgi:hypothetical protein
MDSRKIRFSIFISVLFLLGACTKKNTDFTEPYKWSNGTSVYAPYTLGSTFKYEISIVNPTPGQPPIIDSFTYTVTKDTLINGLKCRKLESNNPFVAGDYFCNYEPVSGVRTEINLNADFGLRIPVLTEKTLRVKENKGFEWGGTFSGTYPSSSTIINGSIAYKLVNRDFSKTVLAKVFADVFEVEQIFSLPAGGGFPSNSLKINNFYAKDFGVIQRDFPADGSFGIYNYKLKQAKIIKN